jgi:hypothetical protein
MTLLKVIIRLLVELERRLGNLRGSLADLEIGVIYSKRSSQALGPGYIPHEMSKKADQFPVTNLNEPTQLSILGLLSKASINF